MWLVLIAGLPPGGGLCILYCVLSSLLAFFFVSAGYPSPVRVNSVHYFNSLAPFTNRYNCLACKFTGFWMLLLVFEVFIGVY